MAESSSDHQITRRTWYAGGEHVQPELHSWAVGRLAHGPDQRAERRVPVGSEILRFPTSGERGSDNDICPAPQEHSKENSARGRAGVEQKAVEGT